MWGDSPAIQATSPGSQQHGPVEDRDATASTLLRGAINTMRRAYPQFMAAGGEELPREMLTVIFPLAYWDLIRKYSAAQRSRSVSGGRADGAGIDLRAGHPVLGRTPSG